MVFRPLDFVRQQPHPTFRRPENLSKPLWALSRRDPSVSFSSGLSWPVLGLPWPLSGPPGPLWVSLGLHASLWPLWPPLAFQAANGERNSNAY